MGMRFSGAARDGETAAQPRGGLGYAGLVALVALLSMTSQLSTDLYMPSLPAMTQDLATTQALTSHTMTVFFLSMSVGMLVFGPISDMVGRRAVLLSGGAVGLAACAACALAPSIEALLALRVVQGLGCGALVAVSTALIKDCFEGRRMAKAIGATQAIAMIAPVVAPLAGAAVLHVAGWRGNFVVLAVLIAVSLAFVVAMKETLPREARARGRVSASFGEMRHLLRSKGFTFALVAGGLFTTPFTAYLGVASYVYEDCFGLSPTAFGVVFAITAVSPVVGSLLYARIEGRLGRKRTVAVAYALCAVDAVFFVVLGAASPLTFMASIVVYTFLAAVFRPLLTNALLAPLSDGAGAASSLINFAFTAFGCIGLVVGSAGWATVIVGMQVVLVASLVISAALWACALRCDPSPV